MNGEMFTLKRWHLIFGLIAIVLTAGIQIGVGLAKFGELEREDTAIKARVAILEEALHTVPALGTKIDALNSRLDLMEHFDITPKNSNRKRQ